jgi:hypothetical protein
MYGRKEGNHKRRGFRGQQCRTEGKEQEDGEERMK